jgi:hypothetical protein
MPHPITDYIYINTARLDAYFEQISSPVAYDKVPSFNVRLSLTGASVGGTQSKQGRQFTTHEKISRLLEHIRKHDQLIDTPFVGGSDSQPFLLESFYARKVFIPPKMDDLQTPEWLKKGLNFWISTGAAERSWGVPNGRIYLLEDIKNPDQMDSVSSWTALSMLRQEYLLFAEYTVAAQYLDDHYSQDEDEFNVKFSENPFTSLAEMGAKVLAEERRITSLFRQRKNFNEPVYENGTKKWRPNIVGYPVFIAAS